MRALVTGAAGFIGSHVVRALVGAGHQVRALHLPTDDLRNLRGLPIELVAGDVLYMLDVAQRNGFTFDAVQMPLNVLDAHFRSFEKLVLPRLVEHGIGVLGMKSMANGLILEADVATPEECLRYALSLPTSVVITGIDSLDILDQAVRVSESEPMADEERAALLARTADTAVSGEVEMFKTTSVFDATARHPDWLGDEPESVQAAAP